MTDEFLASTDNKWICLSVEVVVLLDALAVVVRETHGVALHLACLTHPTGSVIRIPPGAQADNVWEAFGGENPIADGWIRVGQDVAVNLQHVVAVERSPEGAILHVRGGPGDGRLPATGREGEELFRDFWMAGNMVVLVPPT